MRYVTKKELSQLYYLKKEIRQLEQRIKELETAATGCSTKITELPHGTGVNDKIGSYAAQIADLKSLLDLNLKKCFYESNRLDRYIESIKDLLLRQIIFYRFENHMSWGQIERAIGDNDNSESLRKKLYIYLKSS